MLEYRNFGECAYQISKVLSSTQTFYMMEMAQLYDISYTYMTPNI